MADYHWDDTIAAIATPAGEGGIAVIRISGPKALEVTEKHFKPVREGRLSKQPTHTIHLGSIRDDAGRTLDQVLVSIFLAPHSYTGEQVAEISSHGGLVVSRLILDLLIRSGARHAEPGEFTRRAFLNGKIDLTQAEAVLDVIQAKSRVSLETAVRQLGGSLSRRLKDVKERLMHLYAHLEAYVDFPDEDLEVYGDAEIQTKLDAVAADIQGLVDSFQRGSLLREGITLAIVGKPNVGKSSLFNTLAARDRALVSEFAGTTRDYLEELIELNGICVRIIDTAGLAPTFNHPVDQMGMERSRQAMAQADAFLFVLDGSADFEEADQAVYRELPQNKPVFVLLNKSDLESRLNKDALQAWMPAREQIHVSSKTRSGLDQLEEKIAETLLKGPIEAGQEQVTHLRHKHALENALQALHSAREAFLDRRPLDLVTIDLRAALEALKELIGEVCSEDLLDVIFSEFCIGK